MFVCQFRDLGVFCGFFSWGVGFEELGKGVWTCVFVEVLKRLGLCFVVRVLKDLNFKKSLEF